LGGYQLETAATATRQANYVRNTDTYELVFNIEIGDLGTVAFTDFSFGIEPN
jgi:hypothetical protein